MGAFISRQPNGKLCRFSSIIDCVTHYNMEIEEYLNNITGTTHNRADAQDTLDNYMQPFKRVLEDTRYYNLTKKEWLEILNEMGYKEGDKK